MNYDKQDMRKRTKDFARIVIRLFRVLDRNRKDVRILGRQMIRSGTSVGANYREASRARSEAEFIAKIELCTQEADETQYCLELLNEECGVDSTVTSPIWDEADELIRIFVTMSKNTKSKK
jgi:four helix bundle protein